MARLARVVVPNLPHHVIHRGNRGQTVFWSDVDKEHYLRILGLQMNLFGLDVWAYCLMDNHVHLVVVPREPESLAQSIGETHKLYTRMVNFREGWRGSLWGGRFRSSVMDEAYTYAAVRYVERNPVRAGMTRRAEDYPWSSARYRVRMERSPILRPYYLLDEISDWAAFLRVEDDTKKLKEIRKRSSSGRPMGEKDFLNQLEQRLGRTVGKEKPGPKKGDGFV